MIFFPGLGGVSSISRPIIIAEACENHLGSLDVAKKMVTLSKESGADFVKFQHHLREHEMVPGLRMSSNFTEDLYEFLGRCSLNISQHVELKCFCDSVGIGYLCTPFCLEAARELIEHNLLDTAKIGSGELLDFRLLGYLADQGIPMILSTGMSTFAEIHRAVVFLRSRSASFALLHCVSEYPPLHSDVCLDTITKLQQEFPDTIIGFSCHTPDIYTSLGATSLGAKIIEKHVIIDKSVSCPDQSVSLTFDQLTSLTEGVRVIFESLGTRDGVFSLEHQIRSWARRVCVTSRTIAEGETFTRDNLTTMRAGSGLSSEFYFDILGRVATHDYTKGTVLSKDLTCI